MQVTVDGGRELAGAGFVFTYYKEPRIVDIQPNSGPVSGGTTVRVIGSGFNQEGACKRIARFSVFETPTFGEHTDTVLTVQSPPASVPDAVVVGLALNG